MRTIGRTILLFRCLAKLSEASNGMPGLSVPEEVNPLEHRQTDDDGESTRGLVVVSSAKS